MGLAACPNLAGLAAGSDAGWGLWELVCQTADPCSSDQLGGVGLDSLVDSH